MSNFQLEKLTAELVKLKGKQAENKILLKSYKIKSDKLSQLESARKDLMQQINEEKDRIEKEMLEDVDYAEAKKDQKIYKIKIKEKTSEIKELVTKISNRISSSVVDALNVVVDGNQYKFNFEPAIKVILNGKEQK